MAKRSPPTPFIVGSTTASTAAAVMAASTALPPCCSTRKPAADASGWLVATMPFLASTTERVARGLAAGRSPGSCMSEARKLSATAAAASDFTIALFHRRELGEIEFADDVVQRFDV